MDRYDTSPEGRRALLDDLDLGRLTGPSLADRIEAAERDVAGASEDRADVMDAYRAVEYERTHTRDADASGQRAARTPSAVGQAEIDDAARKVATADEAYDAARSRLSGLLARNDAEFNAVFGRSFGQ